MNAKHSSSSQAKRSNGHRRLARGYSVYELATAAGLLANTIQLLESGKPVDTNDHAWLCVQEFR